MTILVFTTIMAIAMILQPAGSLIQQVRGVTEDDGYIVGDDDSQGEVSSQEELENTYEDTPWENNVGPNDFEEAQDRDNNANDNHDADSNDLPVCRYKVVQDCVVNELGQTCLIGTTDDPCQDIFYGYDGDLKPGEKTFNRQSDTNSNDDNSNGNSNSDNIPECKKDVLQECKLSGNTGLLCGVEDLTQGEYNPNVIGDGHACHDVYIGTYNQLEACKDGTYAVSCGSIGVLPGIP